MQSLAQLNSAKSLDRRERRAVERKVVQLAARIQVVGFPWIACTVRNISPMGALLEFEAPTLVPGAFRLIIPQDLFDVDCEVQHVNGCNVGVSFVSNRQGAMARYS